MTQKELSEARDYVERSLKDQAKLGYSRPPKPVVERAVSEAAQAIHTLKSLRTTTSR